MHAEWNVMELPVINASFKVQHAARSETLLAEWPSPTMSTHFPRMASGILLAGRNRVPHIFQASNTCANYEFSRFPERRVSANMHSPLSRACMGKRKKERGSIKLFRSFTDARRFSRAISLPLSSARAYFSTLYSRRLMVKDAFGI